MNCEFEEKQFEQSLNYELAISHEIYAPGQVLEGVLGFDVALLSSHSHLFAAFAQMVPKGVHLQSSWWRHLPPNPDLFPPFKFNVFLQHKRPEFLSTASAREWQSWRGPYFRYDITSHQQVALAALAGCVGNSAIVAYSSPAFWENSSLWDAISAQSLVGKTHFVGAASLSGHGRYTYDSACGRGLAFSEPVSINSLDFASAVRLARESAEYSSNARFLVEVAEHVHKAVGVVAESDDRGFVSLYNRVIEQSDRSSQSGRYGDVRRSLARIGAFCFVTSTSWSIGL